jgi:pimeloyl-ACP methyl ester carboxylesterase
MDHVDVDGLSIAYERTGQGEPLVLLHGYVGDGRSCWHRQREALAEDFTVVAWDAPGTGHSSDPPEFFGMHAYADCLAGFIDRLGLGRTHVAGLSFGGALAIDLVDRHPGVPRSLVLASAYAGWAGSLPAPAAAERLQQALRLSEFTPEQFVDTLLPTMFSAAAPREDVEAFAAAMREFHPRGFRAMARAAAEDLRSALPRVDVPTLLVYGDQDERAPLSVAEDLHRSIAGSGLLLLSGAGHGCNIDAADRFNAAVRDFLRIQPR